ncbi:MAG: putative baseplate assembly protein, partial [Actinomycetota bacterium]
MSGEGEAAARVDGLDPCGCCEGAHRLTPADLANAPGRSALTYRVGTHGTFKETMKAALARHAPLRSLTTREDDDPGVALIDAWATVLDVLTFYQERIANEGYLRTATEAMSVRELARAIGYEPRPGTAAGAHLSFELETAPGTPAVVAIHPGVRVQSLPGPGELPQTYETVEEVEARPEWNAIPARMAAPRPPAMGDRDLFLQGVTTNLEVGEAILLVGKERLEDPTSDRWDVRTLSSVHIDQDAGITRVTWQRPLGWRMNQHEVLPAAEDVRVHALRQRASLFGHNAPDWAAMPIEVQQGYLDRVDEQSANDWPTMSLSRVGTGDSTPHPANTIFLDRAYPKIVAGGWLVLSAPAGEGAEIRELYGIESAVEGSRTDFTLSSKTSELVLSGENLSGFELHIRDATVLAQSEELALSEAPILDPVQGDRVDLGIDVPPLPEGRVV